MSEELKLYLPYLMEALSRAAFRGSLRLMEGEVERIVYFNNGRPVHVQSRLQEETLGRILLDEGRITQADYSKMLEMMVQTRRPAGEVLIALGALGAQDVFSALEFQTKKKLINCFKMVDFGFEIKQEPVPPEFQIANLELAEVVFSGIRAAYSVDRLLSEFPVDEETVFKARSMTSAQPAGMGPKESRIFRTIGDGSSLANLMKGGGELQPLLSTLFAMHALRLIEASSLTRPSTKDLELPGLPDDGEPVVSEQAPSAADESSDGTLAPTATPAEQDPVLEEKEEAYHPETLSDVRKANPVNALLAEKVLSMSREDHFSLLDVSREVHGYELKNAFFRLLRTYQLQDINAAYASKRERELATQLLDRATVAYRELSNDETRKAYLKALSEKVDMSQREVPPRILADVQAQKGELAITGRRYQDAIENFIGAIHYYPEDPSYHYQLGLASYLKAVDDIPADQPLPDAIRKPFLKAIAINPRYDLPRLYMGYISKRNGDLKRALKEFEAAVSSNPNCKSALSEVRLIRKRLNLKD